MAQSRHSRHASRASGPPESSAPRFEPAGDGLRCAPVAEKWQNGGIVNASQLARTCVATADDLLGRRPWRRFANEQVLLIGKADGRDDVAVSILGAAGQEFGVLFLVGESALDDMRAMLGGQSPFGPGWRSTMWAVTLERVHDMNDESRAMLRLARRQGRQAPMFLVREPVANARGPRRAELEQLLELMRALLAADDQGLLVPFGSLDTVVPRLRIDAVDGASIAVALETRRPGAASPQPVEPIELPPGLAGLPRNGRGYMVDVVLVPGTADDDDGGARNVLLLLDPNAERPVFVVRAVDSEAPEAIAAELAAVLRGDRRGCEAGLPGAITFGNRLLQQAMQPALDRLGVASRFARPAALDEAEEELRAYLQGDDEAEPTEPFALVDPPPADDLDGWKQVDRWVDARITECTMRALDANKATQRYFGPALEARRDESPAYAVMKATAYTSWFVHHFVGSKRGRPMAEKLRADFAGPAAWHVLDARGAARPRIYRIAAITVGEGVELEDITTGENVRVADRSLSLSADEGLAVLAAVYPVASFHFLWLAGPVLPAHAAAEAAAFLEQELGHGLDQPVDPRRLHVFGHLWAWWEQRAGAGNPVLQNTEGHALRWHSASFSVEDTAALADALARRADVEEVEPGSAWKWWGPAAARDERVTRGTLELFGDTLSLEVNSVERFEQAQTWLEAIGGVELAGVTERVANGSGEDDRFEGSLDDRIPTPTARLSGEDLEALRGVMHGRYMGWLDESIPALGGQTPREAARTPDGRRRVAQMIRSYPDASGIPGVQVPRADMLRELGLE